MTKIPYFTTPIVADADGYCEFNQVIAIEPTRTEPTVVNWSLNGKDSGWSAYYMDNDGEIQISAIYESHELTIPTDAEMESVAADAVKIATTGR